MPTPGATVIVAFSEMGVMFLLCFFRDLFEEAL